MSLATSVQSKKRIPILQVAKTIVATVAAWFVALMIFPQVPIFAAIAAIIVVQPSVNQSLGKALERSTGTILGVAIALGASLILGSPNWLVLLAIVLALLAGWLFKFTPATTNQIAISAMLVIALGAATPQYAFERIIETIIGALIGVLVNAIIVPPVALSPSRDAIALLGSNIADVLEEISTVLKKPATQKKLDNLYNTSRSLREQLNNAQTRLQNAEESLRFNPFKGKNAAKIKQQKALLNQLAVLVTRTIGVSRGIHDNYIETVIKEPGISDISREFSKAGHDLRLLVRDAGLPAMGQEHPATQEMPALTKPISIKAPSGGNWILIGFLLENLRRIRQEIMGSEVD
jgi:uncharacterized membrane protein YgaE (UPF0421/DUF939 family)